VLSNDLPETITRWLKTQEVADSDAMSRLFQALYHDLRRQAHFALAGRYPGSDTLSTTGLVNEAYLRLCAAEPIPINDRNHFVALAAKTMRWVLMDFARARKRLRRGGEAERVSLDEAMIMSEQRADEILALNEALEHLAELESRLVEVVEHRVFAGLSTEETAACLGVSARTVKRDWRAARAFLTRRLGPNGVSAVE
jgi:RNA polymerase sigma factor (TIGR02999 family)